MRVELVTAINILGEDYNTIEIPKGIRGFAIPFGNKVPDYYTFVSSLYPKRKITLHKELFKRVEVEYAKLIVDITDNPLVNCFKGTVGILNYDYEVAGVSCYGFSPINDDTLEFDVDEGEFIVLDYVPDIVTDK